MDLRAWYSSASTSQKIMVIVGGSAGLYVAYRWYRARSGATAVPSVADAGTDTSSVTDTPGGAYGTVAGSSGGTTQMTNAEWAQHATDLLTQQGWDGISVQTALGRFLTDQTLSDAQVDIVRAAVGVAGNPPEGYHTIHTGGTGTTPTPTTGAPTAAPTGFHNIQLNKTSAHVGWNAVSNATSYEVKPAWTSVSYPSAYPTADFSYLKGGTRYTYKVRAVNSTGVGPWSADQWFLTPTK